MVLAVADGDHSVPPFRGLRDGQPPRLPIGANHNVLRESLPDFTIESTEITETDGKQTRVRTLAFQARPRQAALVSPAGGTGFSDLKYPLRFAHGHAPPILLSSPGSCAQSHPEAQAALRL